MKERFSREFRQYFESPLYDDRQIGDAVVRNHHRLPQREKCVDAIAHRRECSYDLGEEKSDSDIEAAIIKFRTVTQLLQQQGKNVRECILFYRSLRRVKHLGITVKEGYLYNKTHGKFITIGNHVRIRAYQLGRGKKKSRR